MCYHVSSPGTEELIEALLDYEIDFYADNYYYVSGFLRPLLPVTSNTNHRVVKAAQWKLLPFWVKNEVQAKKYANTCNAESESVFENRPTKLHWYSSWFALHRWLL